MWEQKFRGLLLLCTSLCVLADTEIRSRRERPEAEEIRHNLKLGELRLDAAYRLGLSYDSNTNQVHAKSVKEELTALENGLDIRGYWPLKPELLLDFDVYLGYIAALAGDGTEGFVARTSADQTLALDLRLSDTSTLSLLDTVNVNVATVALSAQNNTEDLKTLENDAALQYEVDLSRWYSLRARLGRKMTRTLGSSDFENRDADKDYATLAGDWNVNSALTIGPHASYRWMRHDKPINNDADEYEVGAHGRYQITEVTSLRLSLGYQVMDFDTDNDAAATEDAEGLAAAFEIVSELTERTAHRLTATHEQVYGTTAGINSTRDTTLSYNLILRLNDEWHTVLSMSCFRSEEQTDDGDTSYTYLPGVRVGYRWGDRLSLYTDYKFTVKDSKDSRDREFARHLITFGLEYDF